MKMLSAGKFGAVLAAVGVLGLAGCGSDAITTAGEAPGLPLFAVGDVTNATPQYGKVKVCKVGDVSGTFTVTRTAEGASTGTVEANPTIAAGTCIVVAEDAGASGVGSYVTFTEIPATYLTGVSGQRIDATGPGGSDEISSACLADPTINPCQNPGTVFVNSFHGYTFTFTNILPPPSGCTYTKGWYQNKNGSPTVVGYDSRSKADAQAIFNATPGKPGAVTFGGNNTLLNLYQQLLAALENLAGDETAGPDDVDAAIAAALAGTGGTGTAITMTAGVTQTQMSNWINVLSAFNEGTYPGWPHCDG